MSGIFPREHAGGLPVRDENGNPIYYANVENAYIPPAEFSVSCSINYLPSDCNARFEPRQLNAIQSELLSLAVRFDPDGRWDCNRLDNLSSTFGNWTISNEFYDDVSTSICTRAGTHTKTAVQARVLRMLHCGVNGIEASTFGNLTDVTLCGYLTAISVNEDWGIITCGTSGPVKVTYSTLINYIYVKFGIASILSRIDTLELSSGNTQAELAVIQQKLLLLFATTNSLSGRLDVVEIDLADLTAQVTLIQAAVTSLQQQVADHEARILALEALEDNYLVSTVFNPATYIISSTMADGTVLTTDLSPIKTRLDNLDTTVAGKFDKPTGTTLQYIRGDGSLATLPLQVPSDWNATTGPTRILNKPDLSVFQTLSQKNQPNGYAGLDSTGKLLASQLPAIAITDTFVVDTQAQMLALNVQVGDIAVRTDLNKTFIVQTEPATVLSNWVELRTPTDAVQSVIGLTGPITQAELRAALGLGSAAYMNSSDFASAADGALARTSAQAVGNSGQYIRGDGTLAAFPSIPGTQVNADWNATMGIAAILNKPVLGTAAAMNASAFIQPTGSAAQYIRGDGSFATLPAQVNADWNAATGLAAILNKPDLGTAAAMNASAFATPAQLDLKQDALGFVPVNRNGGTMDADPVVPLGVATRQFVLDNAGGGSPTSSGIFPVGSCIILQKLSSGNLNSGDTTAGSGLVSLSIVAGTDGRGNSTAGSGSLTAVNGVRQQGTWMNVSGQTIVFGSSNVPSRSSGYFLRTI